MPRCLFPCIVLTLGVLAGVSTPAHAAPTRNLLTNPGFESTMPEHSWMPAGWDTSWSTLPTVFFGRDTAFSRAGRYAVSVANVSTLMPLWHNWSQTLVVGPELWNKDVVLSAWTRSNGVQGRGYILVQAYRDSAGKMSRIWGVERDSAKKRIGISKSDDPYVQLAAKRAYFSEEETDWVQRQVRVYIPPSTNIIVVRCGLFGTGQVYFDEASLTAEAALPPAELPVGVNLLQDPGFEGDGNSWDYSMPPYDELRCDRDTTEMHSGKASIRFTGGTMGVVQVRTGAVQLIGNRSLGGKRLRLSTWIKCDSLMSKAYIKMYCTTLERDVDIAIPRQVGGTMPWTKVELVGDVPDDAHQVWVWLLYNGPSDGRVYFDDASLEIVESTRPGKPAPVRKAGRTKTAATR